MQCKKVPDALFLSPFVVEKLFGGEIRNLILPRRAVGIYRAPSIQPTNFFRYFQHSPEIFMTSMTNFDTNSAERNVLKKIPRRFINCTVAQKHRSVICFLSFESYTGQSRIWNNFLKSLSQIIFFLLFNYSSALSHIALRRSTQGEPYFPFC